MRKSFLTCPHKNVQQFTETCMDCGYNIWMSEKDYLATLREEARKLFNKEIMDLEDQLGIER